MAAKDYALVVGITKYPALGDLNGPENDARDFCDWLVHPTGGNVPKANISLILSSDHPPPATPLEAKPRMTEITDVLDRYFERGFNNNGSTGRRLYLYFAGHGFAPELDDAALFMANAARGRTGYHITGRPYANWFRKAAYFSEVVLFMDCCRDEYKRARPQLPPYDDISATIPGERYYGFATKWSRKAREGPWGNGGEPRGIFTLALLDALRSGAPRDAAGQVSGADLESYVINSIRANTSAFAAGEERPDPEFDFNHAIQFKFNTPPTEEPCNPPSPLEVAVADFEMAPPRYAVRMKLEGGAAGRTFRLTTGDDTAIIEASRSATEWIWLIDTPGIYKVTRDDGPSKLFEVIGGKEMLDVQVD